MQKQQIGIPAKSVFFKWKHSLNVMKKCLKFAAAETVSAVAKRGNKRALYDHLVSESLEKVCISAFM